MYKRQVHHATRCPPVTTPMTSCHCPPALFPTTTLYYVTSLDHRHLICRAITAVGCVERCANCSPTNHARWQQHYLLELCGISIFGGVIIAIRICHDTTSLLRYSIRYDISCHHYIYKYKKCIDRSDACTLTKKKACAY